MAETDDDRAIHVPGLQRRVERGVADPVLRRLLKSPLHRPASRWLVLVVFRGRRSGRRYALPALYGVVDDAVVVATPGHESTWWQNFREPRRCTVWHRGTRRPAVGVLVTGSARDGLLTGYLDRYRWLWRRLAGGDLVRARRELRVVRFDLGPPADDDG